MQVDRDWQNKAGNRRLATAETISYAEEDQYSREEALIMAQDAQKSLKEWRPVSSRIISRRVYSAYRKVTVV